jgi:hypothetical protein
VAPSWKTAQNAVSQLAFLAAYQVDGGRRVVPSFVSSDYKALECVGLLSEMLQQAPDPHDAFLVGGDHCYAQNNWRRRLSAIRYWTVFVAGSLRAFS